MPPWWRANSQLNSAVRAPPMWRIAGRRGREAGHHIRDFRTCAQAGFLLVWPRRMNELSAPNIVVAPLEPAPRRISLAWAQVRPSSAPNASSRPSASSCPYGSSPRSAPASPAGSRLPGPARLDRRFCSSPPRWRCSASRLPGLRCGRALLWLGVGLALGCGLVWVRSELVAAPRLERRRRSPS